MSYKIDINSEVTCPYVSSHKVKASKLQAHLVKCAQVGFLSLRRSVFGSAIHVISSSFLFKSNPTIARLYETCPFNFTHKVLGVNLPAHISQCPDKFSTMSHLMRPSKSTSEAT